MSQHTADLSNMLEENYQQNIAALEEISPNLARALHFVQLENLSMQIMPDSQINVIRDGKLLYGPNPLQEIQEQVNLFLQQPQKLQELAPGTDQTKKEESLFHKKYQEIYNKSPLHKSHKIDKNAENQKDIPLYIVFGVGLGYHIELLLEHYDIRHLVIVEDDLEMLKLSLHTANWEKILQRFQASNRSLDLVYGKDGQQATLQLLETIRLTNPIFVTNAHFYKHYSRQMFSDCMEALVEKYLLPSFGWGYFDDEYATVQQTIANLRQDIPFLTRTRLDDLDTPAFIVASGPSLDQSIDYLKEHQNQATIFSCGTALTPLFRAGITPDFHVEMERPYKKYEALMQCADHEFIRGLRMIAPCRVHPSLLAASENSLTYVKHPDAGGCMVDEQMVRVRHDNPTVTNAAFSLACEFGFKDIFLFGTDLGYKSQEKHHAQDTIYYSEDWISKKFNEKMQVAGVNDELVYTTQVFYWTKSALESRLSQEKDISVFNVSDGARIEGTEHIQPSELSSLLTTDAQKDKDIDNILNLFSIQGHNSKHVASKLEQLLDSFDFAQTQIQHILGSSVQHQEEIIDKLNYLYNFIEEQLLERNEACCILLRGSFRHFSRLIYSHSAACPDPQASVQFINQALPVMYDFLDQAREMLEALKIPEQEQSVE